MNEKGRPLTAQSFVSKGPDLYRPCGTVAVHPHSFLGAHRTDGEPAGVEEWNRTRQVRAPCRHDDIIRVEVLAEVFRTRTKGGSRWKREGPEGSRGTWDGTLSQETQEQGRSETSYGSVCTMEYNRSVGGTVHLL